MSEINLTRETRDEGLSWGRLPLWMRWILPFVLLLLMVLVIYRQFAFTNLILARGDTYLYFYPYWHGAAEALRAGRLPFWNPDLFMGAPFLANSQVGFFYPLNWPLWYFLDTPYAASASILLHVFIGACGAYVTGRRLKLSVQGALVAAVLFAMGGYFAAKSEHLNQLQGLAYLPWLFAVTTDWSTLRYAQGKFPWGVLRRGGLIALFFGLQLLAGHTQTTFISAVGVGMWMIVQTVLELTNRAEIDGNKPAVWKNTGRLVGFGLAAIVVGVGVALLVSAVQLLPTLELQQLSRRQGGLPVDEALSFSFHPLLLAQGVLPIYGQSPYIEYVAYLPLVGFVLAVLGVSGVRKNRLLWGAVVLVFVGILFGLGKYSFVMERWMIHVPGFALFRAPARWMVLYSFGMALLAGAGWDKLGQTSGFEKIRRPFFVGVGLILLLMLAVPWSAHLGQTSVPMPPESPAQDPRWTLWVGWLLELLVILGVFLLANQRLSRFRYVLLAPLVLSLFFSERTLFEPALTTPEAFFDVRQSVARLQVSAEQSRLSDQPVGRFLSMSKGFFDPGDQGEIDSIYADQLTEEQLYRYTVTAKSREIVVPNLTMVYGLSAVDGFDGGLLPLYDYSAVTGLILPGEPTVDGRLREELENVPPDHWLDLFGVQYLITDKTGDQWFQFEDGNVFFDLQHRVTLQPNESVSVGYLPPFESAELWIIAEGSPGQVQVSAGPATDQWQAQQLTDVLQRAVWSEPGTPDGLTLTATDGEWKIAGLALVDSGRKFQQIVPGNYKLAHSGDVKVYENLDVLPRAFLVNEWSYAPDVDSAVAMMMDNFDPRTQAVIEGSGEAVSSQGEGTAEVTSYAPEKIIIQVNNPSNSLLVITDAFYPGWTATVDGRDTPIEKVNGMFRGIQLPANAQQIEMTYSPNTVRTGARLTLVGIIGITALITIPTALTRLKTQSAL